MGIEYAVGHKDCPEVERGRGYKDCPCGMRLPSLIKKCECGHIFYTVRLPKKSKLYKEVRWQDLSAGDSIYIENTDTWVNPEGEMIPMGESGEYLVIRLQSDGIVVYNKTGYGFQNMVNVGYNAQTGITRGATKVFRKDKKDD